MLRLRLLPIFFLLLGVGYIPAAAQADGQALIAYTARADGNLELFVTTMDGSFQERLTYTEADEATPVWSPDGTQLAYSTTERQRSEFIIQVLIMDADGSNVTLVTEATGFVDYLDWSPDGRQLLFTATGMGGPSLYTVDIDGDNLNPVVEDESILSASWSPNGTEIYVISENDDGDLNLSSLDADGDSLRLVTDAEMTEGPIAWSRDGESALMILAEGRDASLYITNDTFRRPMMLVETVVLPDSRASWSPDGAFIAFDHADGGIAVVDVESGEIFQVTTDGFYNSPAWQPVGTTFVSGPGGGPELGSNDFIELELVETCEVYVPRNVNLRDGPSTAYAQLGVLEGGQTVDADLQAREGTLLWWRLGREGWVRWDVVQWADDCQFLPRENGEERVMEIPLDRETPPDDARLLRNGRSMVTDKVMDDGEIQVEYFCGIRGLKAVQNKNNWVCNNAAGQRVIRLEPSDFDLICQQTYWNSFAFAIQDGRYNRPSLNWRCYEMR